MVTFLNMATSTVYKMAGLGAFKASQTYRTAMGETVEAEEEVQDQQVCEQKVLGGHLAHLDIVDSRW